MTFLHRNDLSNTVIALGIRLRITITNKLGEQPVTRVLGATHTTNRGTWIYVVRHVSSIPYY